MSPKALIPTIVSQLNSPTGVTLRSVEPIRDYLHVSDAARAIVAVAQSSAKGVFNVGSGDAVSVRTVFERIVALSGKIVPALSIADQAAQPSCIRVDLTRSQKFFNWHPELELGRGLQEYLEGQG